MTNRERYLIVKNANQQIKLNHQNFNNLENGLKEAIQDKYIEEASQKLGWRVTDFYATNGKNLKHILIFS